MSFAMNLKRYSRETSLIVTFSIIADIACAAFLKFAVSKLKLMLLLKLKSTITSFIFSNTLRTLIVFKLKS